MSLTKTCWKVIGDWGYRNILKPPMKSLISENWGQTHFFKEVS